LKTTEVVVGHLEPPTSIPAKLEAFDAVVNGVRKAEAEAVGAGV
jgi:hypothetical protein